MWLHRLLLELEWIGVRFDWINLITVKNSNSPKLKWKTKNCHPFLNKKNGRFDWINLTTIILYKIVRFNRTNLTTSITLVLERKTCQIWLDKSDNNYTPKIVRFNRANLTTTLNTWFGINRCQIWLDKSDCSYSPILQWKSQPKIDPRFGTINLSDLTW